MHLCSFVFPFLVTKVTEVSLKLVVHAASMPVIHVVVVILNVFLAVLLLVFFVFFSFFIRSVLQCQRDDQSIQAAADT